MNQNATIKHDEIDMAGKAATIPAGVDARLRKLVNDWALWCLKPATKPTQAQLDIITLSAYSGGITALMDMRLIAMMHFELCKTSQEYRKICDVMLDEVLGGPQDCLDTLLADMLQGR
jgi:hypothetical protein